MKEKKADILFIVESAINKNDGYKSRVEMEMGLLGNNYNFSILIPWEGQEVHFLEDIKIYTYKAVNERLPFVFNKLRLQKKLKGILKNKPNCIVYCEALPSAVCVYDIVKKYGCKLVYDCHGTAPDEVYLYHPNFLGKSYANWLRKQQRKVVEGCDLLVTVSKRQYDFFETKKPYVLLPMLPAKQFQKEKIDKKEVREKLDIPHNAIVFCYSGQNQKWQMSEETIEYYKKIENMLPNTFLLILTGNVDDFKKLCKKNELKNYLVKKVPYDEMQYHLDAADYGFCLRKNHIINLVASPTKVLEYLSRNVIPIITQYVGDFSEQLSKEKLCVCLENFESIDYSNIKEIKGKEYVSNLMEKRKDTFIKAMALLGEIYEKE